MIIYKLFYINKWNMLPDDKKYIYWREYHIEQFNKFLSDFSLEIVSEWEIYILNHNGSEIYRRNNYDWIFISTLDYLKNILQKDTICD